MVVFYYYDSLSFIFNNISYSCLLFYIFYIACAMFKIARAAPWLQMDLCAMVRHSPLTGMVISVAGGPKEGGDVAFGLRLVLMVVVFDIGKLEGEMMWR